MEGDKRREGVGEGWVGVIGDQAFLGDKEEIIQTISRSHCAIIRSHLFSRAVVLFIELLCCRDRRLSEIG